MYRKLPLYVVLWTGALPGCASFATFQELDTMAKGTNQVGLGATVTGYELDLGEEEPEALLIPAANLWARYGVTDRLEAHGRIWMPLGATVGGKVQLLGDRTKQGFGLATGLDVGYLRVSIGETSATWIDTYVPLYTGYRVSESFTTYLSPKYLLRTQTGTGDTAFSHSLGGTLGLAAGRKTRLYLEGTGVYDLSVGGLSWDWGLGIGF